MFLREELRGADVAGRDAVHADAAPRELDGKAAHQPDDTGLRGRIVHMLIPAIGDAHDRGERDDRARAALDHRRRGRPHNAENALQVDVEGVVPFLVGKRGERYLVGDAGIGDERIERAERCLDVGDDGWPVCVVSVTSSNWNSALPPPARDLVGDGSTFFGENVGDDDMIARFCEGLSPSPARSRCPRR